MRRSPQEIIERLQAANSINLHLLLALYDAIENKDRVISQFSDVTEKTATHTLYSEMPDSFFDEFETQREAILQMLVDARAL